MAPRGVLLSELFLNSLIGEVVKGIKRWLKIFCGEKNSFLGCFKVASWSVFSLKINSANWFFLNNRGSQGENVKGINLTLKRGGGQGCVNTKIFQARNDQICDDVSDQREKTLGTDLHGCKNYVFKTTNGLI